MLTYQDVTTIKIGFLTKAATSWDDMADGFKELETLYKTQVESVANDGVWVGVAAGAASSQFSATRKQLADAQVEARAIASILRDAHHQFSTRIADVKEAAAQARKAKLSVNSKGEAVYDYSKLTPMRHDENYPDYVAKAKKAEASWTKKIKDAVQAVDDADQGVKLALHEAAGIKGFFEDIFDRALGQSHNFNGHAVGDIERYEAAEARQYAKQVLDGEKPDDLKEFRRLMRDNSGDVAFSRTLLDGLGARKTLELANKIDEFAYFDDKKHGKQYLEIQTGLADSLATATRDPKSEFYKHFRSEMRKAGIEKYNMDGLSKIPDEKIRGYQSLATLIQRGHGYSGQFLKDTADDIRHAEETYVPPKGHYESIWALRDGYSGKDRGWFANDPLDSVLGVMSRDPATSTEYLDPAKTDNLKYLLHNRDWETAIDHYATPPGGTTTGPPVMAEDGDVRKGFGAALEAATTGEKPGTYHQVGQHTLSEARIMQHTVNTLYSDGHAEALPKNLIKPLAHALTSYTPDTHEIYAKSDSSYDIDWKSPGSVWKDEDGAHMAVGYQRIAAIMRGVADDPEAFGHLYGAEQQHSHDVLAAIPRDAGDKTITDRIRESSRAIGAYDGVRSDIIFDERFNKTQWAADFNQGLSTSLNTALMFKPDSLAGAGDLTSKVIDVWVYESNKDHVAEANVTATNKNAETYDAGLNDVEHMVRAWGNSRGHDIDSDYTKFFLHDSQEAYDFGRNRALDTFRSDR
ncbi:hypothetical protein [Streptomyces coffeae]|uniref:WXG100 family type VII secretion target n=1 Tax=Streptomyces coffeae TaxID=621382 RepID=A0ABS1N968_9ACTN|nr:hypothetical protein [Streptomyces coffeae]MBL1096621.1 hypothetical protein [Streptomyces coffeae]